jgi:hypothetical protein
MSIVAEDTILKVTMAPDGEVWYLDGDRLPCRAGACKSDFLYSYSARLNADRIRVVGSPQNAKLILRLYELKLRDELASVEVCSPLVCSTAQDRADPEKVLFNMRRWSAPSTMGGWHEVTRSDYVAYAMSMLYQQNAEPHRLIEFLREHPAYPGLSFLYADHLALARLVSIIIDPRWYIDSSFPDRPGKLYAFLGLDPATQKSDGTGRHAYLFRRNRLTQDVWDVPGADMKKPGAFVQRFRAMTDMAKEPWWGDLRTSQRLVSFVRGVMMDALYPMPNVWGESLFVPEHFFKQEGEQFAYRHHVRTYGNRQPD